MWLIKWSGEYDFSCSQKSFTNCPIQYCQKERLNSTASSTSRKLPIQYFKEDKTSQYLKPVAFLREVGETVSIAGA